ncbi:hypothetical protein LINPERPRIM_LOCUS34490 [Linum perenne]
MSSKGPTTPKSPSTRNRSKAKLKKENGVASLSGPSESAKNPLKNGANLQFEPSRVQCGPIRQKKKGGSKSKGNSPSGKKHKVVESWQWNHRPFSPRQNQQQQQQQQKRKKPWQGAEQGMAYYLNRILYRLVETQDSKLGQNCLICERDLSYAPIPPETESGTYNFPEVAVLGCGHVFHMICFSSYDQSTDPSCFKCAAN